jgi:gamma-glutamylputrescine oxidase
MSNVIRSTDSTWSSTPFWRLPGERYPGNLPDRADVLVIGGGIAGLSLIHHLGRSGSHDAALVERSRLAAGASGRNAGFLLAGVAANYAEAVRTYGREKARDVWHLTSENHDLMVEAVEGDSVGHRRAGSATLASGVEEARQLEESDQLLREDGFEASWDGQRLINPRDGEANPAAIVGALARRAPRGAIREGVEVSAIEPSRDGVTVHAGGRECRAGAVILATNAYTPLLVPQIAIQPTRAQMLASAPIPRPVCDLPTYSHNGYRYWRQVAGGEVLVGGWRDTSMDTEIGYDEHPTPGIQAHLNAQLERLSPGAKATHRWAGIMGFTESGLPMVGPVAGMPNVHICAGFNGHGMGFAFISAKHLVAALIS